MIKYFYKKLLKTEDGFSLIEVAFVLVVIGIFATFVLKNQGVVDSARLKTVLFQSEQLLSSIQLQADRSDFPFKDGKVTSIEQVKEFWKKLKQSGAISSDFNGSFPTSKVGGVYTISSSIPGHPGLWLVLSGDHEMKDGVLTGSQAKTIDSQCDDGNPALGNVQAINSVNNTGCLRGEDYDVENTNKACIVMFKIF